MKLEMALKDANSNAVLATASRHTLWSTSGRSVFALVIENLMRKRVSLLSIPVGGDELL